MSQATTFAGLENRVALVSGAANGIGFAIARALVCAGSTVLLTDVADDDGARAKAALESLGRGSVDFMHADAADEDDVAWAIAGCVGRHGRLDILVNNAGMQHVAPVEEFPSETFEAMIRLMLVGPFLAIKHALPAMRSQGFGRILNIASINGLVGFPGKAAYNAAKHGLIGLTRVVALETARDGITVNAICPGYVDTELVRRQQASLALLRGVPAEAVLEEVIYPLVPQRRLLDVQEVASYALFLASDLAKGVTGQAVVVDGGYVAQ